MIILYCSIYNGATHKQKYISGHFHLNYCAIAKYLCLTIPALFAGLFVRLFFGLKFLISILLTICRCHTQWRHRSSIQIADECLIVSFCLFGWLLLFFTSLAILLILCVILCIDYQCVPKPIGRRQYVYTERENTSIINTLNSGHNTEFSFMIFFFHTFGSYQIQVNIVYFWSVRIFLFSNTDYDFSDNSNVVAFFPRIVPWLLLDFLLQC